MNDVNIFPCKDSIYLKKISSKTGLSQDDECEGYLIESSENEARKIIDSLKGKNKVIAVFGKDDFFNRRAIETLKINFLVSPEKGEKKESKRQIDSGLNHVIAKEAKKRNISIVIDLSEFARLEKKEKVKTISKMIQNVKICRKAKCSIKIASLASRQEDLIDEKGRQAFGSTLGMSSEQVKDSIIF